MKKMSLLSSILIFALTGCEKENFIVTEGMGSLYDPNIRPAVIYTYPANNSTGSFQDFNPSGNYTPPHFILQFNKVMSISYSTLNKLITVTGFDVPVVAELYTSSSTTGLYQFMIRDAVSGRYLPYRLGKKYTITVSQEVKDMHGYTLTSPFTFSFTKESEFRVVSSTPKDSLSSGNSTISIQFNSEVDESILSKISIAPAVVGNWLISGSLRNSVYFYSSNGYQSGTMYTVTVPTTVKDIDGNALTAPYSFQFKSGDFRIDYTSPSNNSTSVSLTQYIYVNFNGLINTVNLSNLVTITPAIAGTFEAYSGASYFYFRPTEPYKEQTKYTVTVDSTLRSTSGQMLSSKVTFSFTTEGFRIVEFLPYNYNGSVSRYSNIDVRFNAPVDTSTVAGGITIQPSVAGKFSFSSSFRRMTFRPDSALAPNTQYAVTFNTSVKSKIGNSLMNAGSSYYFTTEN